MSYDLYLFKLKQGFDLQTAHEEADARAESGDDEPPESYIPWTGEELERLAGAITAADRKAEVFRSDDDEGQTGTIEITGSDDLGYQWMLSSNSVVLTWPYSLSEAELRAVLTAVRPGLEAARRMGARILDPQLDRDLDPVRDMEMIVEVYESVKRRMRGGGGGGGGSGGGDGGDGARKPWWKFW